MSQSVTSAANAGLSVVNTPVVTGGASAGGDVLAAQKDLKEAQTDPKFGEIWQQIQGKYGAKPEKPREFTRSFKEDDIDRDRNPLREHKKDEPPK